MSQALVCSANGEYRSSCEVLCGACSFLIKDRRGKLADRIRWSPGERRLLTNLVPSDYQYAGAEGLRLEGEVDSRTVSWYLLAMLISFNLLDCLLTARALSLGYMEANPVMDVLFQVSIPLGMLGKTVIVAAGALVLWKYRHLNLAARGLTLLTAVYGVLVLYHLSFQLIV